MDKLANTVYGQDYDEFESAVGGESDPTMLVLRGHLYTENTLERLILALFPRGDRLIESGNLSFHHKLAVVNAFDVVPDSAISSLRNLNKIRNQAAHNLNKSITASDVAKIGSPFGKRFTEIKKDAEFDVNETLRGVIHYLCGYLDAVAQTKEHPSLTELPDYKE
ncbi:MAG: hypothetical protein Marn2KO_21150 [Marinobacter nauticus]|uniref:hypothetical protein n=1 Tax=Marinobacter mangrovi TaxID=2803918 RepID=UPI001932DD93|nr:hypothetical protein [Marinobacter mangrovi]